MPERTAAETLARSWDFRLPVNVHVIARNEGVILSGEKMEHDISGKFFLNEEGKPVIIFNRNDSLMRQRFAIAHELGHFLLRHGSQFTDSSRNFSEEHSDYFCRKANIFSVALLIPDIAVEMAVFRKNLCGLSEMEKLFEVSAGALRYRFSSTRIDTDPVGSLNAYLKAYLIYPDT